MHFGPFLVSADFHSLLILANKRELELMDGGKLSFDFVLRYVVGSHL